MSTTDTYNTQIDYRENIIRIDAHGRVIEQ